MGTLLLHYTTISASISTSPFQSKGYFLRAKAQNRFFTFTDDFDSYSIKTMNGRLYCTYPNSSLIGVSSGDTRCFHSKIRHRGKKSRRILKIESRINESRVTLSVTEIHFNRPTTVYIRSWLLLPLGHNVWLGTVI